MHYIVTLFLKNNQSIKIVLNTIQISALDFLLKIFCTIFLLCLIPILKTNFKLFTKFTEK